MIDQLTVTGWIEDLDSLDFEVRQEAKSHLSELGSAVIEPLIAAAHTSTPRKCWEAANLLAQITDPRAVKTLQALVGSSHPILGQVAARALIRYGELSTQALVTALPTSHGLPQLEIVSALEQIGARSAVVPLMELLRTTDSSVLRYTIVQALGKLGDPQALDLIRSFADDPDHHVRKRVETALKSLTEHSQTLIQPPRNETKTMIPLMGKRVFYVEDDVKNRAIVKTILELAGASVASESWGQIDMVTSRLENFLPVDLILLDLMFPKNVSGYDIFDVLHGITAFSKIPVVAVSASDPAIEVPKVRAKGFNGFITKPIDLHSFPDQIADILVHKQFWYAG